MGPLADARARSTAATVLLWGTLLLVGLIAVSVALSIAVSLVYSIVMTLLPIVVLGALAYLVARLVLSDGGGATSRGRARTGSRSRTRSRSRADDGSLLDRLPGLGGDSTREPRGRARDDDPVDRLTDRYLAGEIDEAEYERRLELELDGPEDLDSRSRRSRSRDTEFDR